MSDHRLRRLLDPSEYPETATFVTHIQTHISHIFITDRYAYKIKKPVDFGFLNFTTLDKRKRFCNEELRLNRRLSPDIYLDVIPLFDDDTGSLSFKVKGEPAEYAVKMLRLPDERMMSRLLDERKVSLDDIQNIASVVASFHLSADRNEHIARFGSIDTIRQNWLDNLCQTEAYIGRTITSRDHSLITRLVQDFIAGNEDLLRKRVDGGFIRDCDGDLHSENICLDNGVHIFDCIEFSEKFRFSDTAADVAFLAMDLEQHGRQDLSRAFVSSYMELTGDSSLQGVLPLYLANRAFIRGKVASLCLDDAGIDDAAKKSASLKASRYFRLARGYLIREELPRTIFITSGPTGCGKSALATELCFQLGIRHISSDLERKRLAGVGETERDKAIYSAAWNSRTYEMLADITKAELSLGRTLLVDATFRTVASRKVFRDIAREYEADFVIIRPICSEEIARRNIEARSIEGSSPSDGTWAVYQSQINDYEAPNDEEGRVVASDSAASPQEMVDSVLSEIGLFE